MTILGGGVVIYIISKLKECKEKVQNVAALVGICFMIYEMATIFQLCLKLWSSILYIFQIMTQN